MSTKVQQQLTDAWESRDDVATVTSVQCSQLRIGPETIQTSLSVILQSANRWNPILLLDEADVYTPKEHSNDGVVLQILEHAQYILFMTADLEANNRELLTTV